MAMATRHPDRSTIAQATGVAIVGVLPVFLTGALAVQVRADLDLRSGFAGIAAAPFFLTAALASAVGGRVAERVGPSVSLRVAAAGSATSLILIALIARSLVSLSLPLVLGGLAVAIGQPSANLALARSTDQGRLGLAFGIKQSAIPTATLLGGLAVPALALTVGWRWAYGAAAALAVVLAALPVEVPTKTPQTPPNRGRSSGDVALTPLVLLAVGAGLAAASANTLGVFLVSSAVDAGIAEGTAGLLAAGCSAVMLATRLGAGARADRRQGRHLVVVWVMLGGGSLAFVALATGSVGGVVTGAFIAFCLAWGWPGLFNLAVVRNNPGTPGAATGITQTGVYLGAMAGPLLFGLALDAFSYGPAWLGSGAVTALGAAAIWSGRRLLLADRQRRQPVG